MVRPSEQFDRDYDLAVEQREEQNAAAAAILEGEISVLENPVLAEMQGVTRELIVAGAYEPSGSTTKASGAFVAAVKPSTKRYDARDKRNNGLQGHEGYLVLSGSRAQVKSLLADCAETRDVPTIIGAETPKEFGLTHQLTKHEVAAFARLGAKALDSNKHAIPLHGAPGLKA